jgi:GGDEF domain-containing protein
MVGEHTAPVRRVTELQKARLRLPLLTLVALLGPVFSGVRSASVWIVYVVFVVLYSLWTLRLSRTFSGDRRLGYLLCLTDVAILLPLLVWSSAVGLQIVLALVCAGGLALTYAANRSRSGVEVGAQEGAPAPRGLSAREWQARSRRAQEPSAEELLERAVRTRLQVFTATGARFGLVVLRIARFEEASSYFGEEAAGRLLSAVSRRGLRLLGPDAQNFALSEGKVAFLFETEPDALQGHARYESSFAWSDPYDVEGLAMTLGRKVCEHLVDGHRVECVVGWASAPADGLTADDLLYVAETGAQSTAAFRRVAGSSVPVPERARAATG